jgi:hypothetical protein
VKLPTPHASDIDVDEIGSSIIPDTAAMQAESHVAEFGSAHSRYANIDRHGLHVQAVLGHAVTVGAEILIAPGCTVTADNIYFGIRMPKRRGEIMQKIEHTRIVIANVASPVIA